MSYTGENSGGSRISACGECAWIAKTGVGDFVACCPCSCLPCHCDSRRTTRQQAIERRGGKTEGGRYRLNPADDEAGIDGVTVDLYRDHNGNGMFDSADTLIGSTVTGDNPATPGVVEKGWYSFSIKFNPGGSFGNYAWDPQADIFYASAIGQPTWKYQR